MKLNLCGVAGRFAGLPCIVSPGRPFAKEAMLRTMLVKARCLESKRTIRDQNVAQRMTARAEKEKALQTGSAASRPCSLHLRCTPADRLLFQTTHQYTVKSTHLSSHLSRMCGPGKAGNQTTSAHHFCDGYRRAQLWPARLQPVLKSASTLRIRPVPPRSCQSLPNIEATRGSESCSTIGLPSPQQLAAAAFANPRLQAERF